MASETDHTISQVIRVLGAVKGVASEDVARAAGIERSTFYRRMRGGSSWHACEVAEIAHYFDVSPGVFFDGPAGALVEHPGRRRTDRRKRGGGGGEFAELVMDEHPEMRPQFGRPPFSGLLVV